MICPCCHKENEDSKKFCTYCGAKLYKVYYCTSCGNALSPDQKFCIKCGTPNPHFSTTQINTSSNKHSVSLNENISPVENSTSYPIFTQSTEQNPIIADKSDDSALVQPQVEQRSSIVENSIEQPTHTINQQIEDASETSEAQSSANENSVDLPVYEENEEIGKRTPWIVWVVVALLLGGGVVVTGQFLNWWNISALSWIGRSGGSNKEMVAVDSDSIMEVAAEDVEIEPAVSIIPDMKVLKGYIGDKYAVEMMLSGESVDEGTAHYFMPLTGKYRYTKNNGDWINVVIDSTTNINDITSIVLKEYTDGNLTGTWDVKYNMSDNTIKGLMTNYKGDTYSVNLSANSSQSGVKEGYNKITGNVVTDSKDYPFYIDFQYEAGEIADAVYHNPDYNTVYNLNVARISDGEYYFEGDHNGQTMIITFSASAPYKGTIEIGSNIRKIKMDL